ncbi:hypothetical protein EDB89DRAFT_1966278 [Lactarius sanguifluus]|nr:hypothetical protein EDB89DRAFT_1966278 [Lactarius sanguifluus]
MKTETKTMVTTKRVRRPRPTTMAHAAPSCVQSWTTTTPHGDCSNLSIGDTITAAVAAAATAMTTYGNDRTMLRNWVHCGVCSSSLQVIVFVLHPSKSSNSLAMWRCKVAVPNSIRLSHLCEIELAMAMLRKPLPDRLMSLLSRSVPLLTTAKKTMIVSKSTTMADDDNCDSKAATTTT